MSKRQVKRENAELREQLSATEETLNRSLDVAEAAVRGLASVTPLTAEGAAKFFEEYPQWRIDINVRDGEMTKVFTRDIADLSPELHNDDDTYKSLADPEYFDGSIATIFGAYSGNGTYYGKAEGGFAGGSITISVPIDMIGLTVLDEVKIRDAEDYFQDTYVRQPALA